MTHEFEADMIHHITCTVSERYDTLHVLYCQNLGCSLVVAADSDSKRFGIIG